jgi:Zn finger protein HypA/HybF involved in hydrogenase expression
MRHLTLLGLVVLLVGPLAAQERTTSPHGDLKTECSVCHQSKSWSTIQVSSQFDHGKLGFPLTGAHGATTCRSCHVSLNFKNASASCSACHTDNHRGEFGTNCARCHTTRSFTDRDAMAKEHQLTRFPLSGSHLATDCAACHKPSPQGQMQFLGTPTTCVSCHQTNYNVAPNHVASRYPTTCDGCHTTVTWNAANLGAANHPVAPIALTGVHSANLINCTQCHTTTPYSSVQTACVACHQTAYNGAKDPDHVAANFPTTCTDCHGLVAGWLGAKYDHPTAPVALTGAHSPNLVTCSQCHTTMPYSTVKQTCDGCHHAEYVATSNPSHTATGYGTDCASCHQVVANWAGASVNHPSTPIALTGVHSSNLVTCTQCHTTTPYSTVKQTCDGCHHTDYVGAKDPDHVAGNFSTTCTTCHTLVAGWAGATFNHPTAPVALTGAHSPNLVTCAQCHTTMPYSTVKQTCDGCHHADYVATSNPNHTSAGYGTDCASCHQVVANWAGASVNHPSTPIALTGVHSANLVNCTQCHTTTPYSTVKTTCDGCHHTDYVGAKDPDHVAGNFSTTCTTCHGLVSGWLGATFNHPTSPIALTGAHSSNLVNCSQCHTTMPYSTVKQTCDGCHHADYVATTNPNHTAAGYSTDCSSCHQVVANWAGATFNHPTAPIALTGVHSTTAVQCTQCHTTMPYSTVKQTCDGCHQAEFTATTDPNHVAASFSLQCTTCHALVAGWTGAKFLAHDGSISQFRIYSGKHLAKWSQCSECHRLGQPYAATPSLLCLNCHGQVQNDTHRGKNYTPSDCVRSGCHANGSKP